MSDIKKISKDEQRKIRDSAKAELERLERIQTKAETMRLLDAYKYEFNVCETVYKVVLGAHQRNRGKFGSEQLKVTMTQVPYALDFAGYNFDKELLKELFGSKSNKGMTVKKLRDAVTHGIDEKAVEEIAKRKDELFGYMYDFLNTIKFFDQTA